LFGECWQVPLLQTSFVHTLASSHVWHAAPVRPHALGSLAPETQAVPVQHPVQHAPPWHVPPVHVAVFGVCVHVVPTHASSVQGFPSSHETTQPPAPSLASLASLAPPVSVAASPGRASVPTPASAASGALDASTCIMSASGASPPALASEIGPTLESVPPQA
jgi:hypothetical protein